MWWSVITASPTSSSSSSSRKSMTLKTTRYRRRKRTSLESVVTEKQLTWPKLASVPANPIHHPPIRHVRRSR